MKITALPTTKLGTWSIFLALGVFVFFFITRRMAMMLGGRPGNETFFGNPFAAISAILAWLSGAGAFVAGAVSFIKSRERSIFVGLAALFGLFVTLFGLGEFLVPH
jgi:hypothetical protein